LKIKLERPLVRFINLCLSAFFAFGLLILFEQFGYRGWEWYSRSLRSWPILLCYIGGTAAGRPGASRRALLPLSCLIAGITIYLSFPFRSFPDIVYIVLALAVGAGLFMIGLRDSEAFPPRVAVASVIIYIVALLYFDMRGFAAADYAPVSWCALASFLLSLYSLNNSGLMSGVHNAKGGDTMAMPSGIRGRNILLLSLFIAVAVLIGSLAFLHRFLSGVSVWLLRSFAGFLLFLSRLNGGGGAPQPSPTPAEEEDRPLLPEGDAGDPTFVAVYVVLLALLGAALALYLIFGTGKAVRGSRALGRLAALFRRLFKPRRILEYEDSVERTLDLKGLLKSGGVRLRELWGRLSFRPERFEDMPDNRMRVRFAYKMLLRSGRVDGWLPSSTPAEVGAAMRTESLRSLTESYNFARYDEIEAVPDEAAENARKALGDMKGRGRHG